MMKGRVGGTVTARLVAAGLVAVVAASTAGGCTPFYGGHASAPHDGYEWHTCEDGSECREGYACTRHGCEWCGDDDGVRTRCTEGMDGFIMGR